MAINPLPPVPGLIKYEYRHGADFLPPAHLIKQGPAREVDPSMVPEVEIDTTYDEDKILANEPTPKVLPIFLGLRTALATRRIERANNKVQDLSRLHRVAHHVGRSMLAGNIYTGTEDADRPSTHKERKVADKLDKINTKRHRAGARVFTTSRSSAPPVSATWAESKEAHRHAKEHDRTNDKIDDYNDRFRAVIRKPARKAVRSINKRNRLVAKREALELAIDRRDARRLQMRDSLIGSATALGQEIAESHQESLDMTKEQAERLRVDAARSGRLAVHGTVALTRFYKEVGQNAGNLYARGGKYVARQTAKHASRATAKVRSRVRPKRSKHSD